MSPIRPARLASLIAGSLLASACNSVGPGAGRPVSFSVTSTHPGATTVGPLALTSFRLVVGGVALGSGDQFGCVDCTGSQAPAAPLLVNVPLDGSPVSVRTEEVQPGTYGVAEIEVVKPTSPALQGVTGWIGANTIELAGTFGGAPFTLAVAVEGTFRQTLATAIVVSSGGGAGTAAATFTLPITAWFQGTAGPLDPTSAADRALIEAQIRNSFGPLEGGQPEGSR